MLSQTQNIIVKDDLTCQEIEAMMSDDNIIENPKLLDMMDDNLSISITDLCMYYKLTKNTVLNVSNLIEAIASSKILTFDKSKGIIHRQAKGLRRIILFQEVPHDLSIKDFLIEKGFSDKIVKFDDANKDYIKVFFSSEEEALDVIIQIEKIKWKDNLEFRCQIKCESFKCNISNEIYLRSDTNQENSISLKKAEFHIFLNKEKYTPRILIPDVYSNNSYTEKQRIQRKHGFKNNKSKSWKYNDYSNNYFSNSTKESSEEDLNKKKKNNKKALNLVYEKLKKTNSINLPYVMKKNFNPVIMEKKPISVMEKSSYYMKEEEGYQQTKRTKRPSFY